MKVWNLVGGLALAGLVLTGATAHAGEGKHKKADPATRMEHRWARILERFDQDGDGKLNKDEWVAKHAARKDHKGAHHAGKVGKKAK